MQPRDSRPHAVYTPHPRRKAVATSAYCSHGAVAQLVERVVRNDEVESSILFRSTCQEMQEDPRKSAVGTVSRVFLFLLG